MPVPALTKTWTITPNNRISYVSLNDTMARYLFGVKQFLKANGYTVRGSSDGTTGAMDLVDRWITSANVTTRGAAAGNAQSWIILRDGAGVDILLTYQGASDDIARISFSPGQLFIVAAPPQNQPTATDEQVVSSAVSLISATASGDRLWFGWVDSTSRLCRFAIARQNAWVGRFWGIEEFTPAVVAPATLPVAVWGFALTVGTSYLTGGGQVGVARAVISGTPFNCAVFLGMEFPANNPQLGIYGSKAELQGGYGYIIQPMTIWSTTASARGKLGTLIDTYTGRQGPDHGSPYGTYQYIAAGQYVGGGISGLWPWDGVTTPIMF